MALKIMCVYSFPFLFKFILFMFLFILFIITFSMRTVIPS